MAGEDRQDPGRRRLTDAGATPSPAHDCPRCGGPNRCAPAASGRFDAPCWCRGLRIDPSLLAALPAAERGHRCLCPACAASDPALPLR